MQSARFVDSADISRGIRDAIATIFCKADSDVIDSIRNSINSENHPIARDILRDIVSNAEISQTDLFPTCQDTGTLVVFVQYGSAVHLGGANLRETIETAASQSWQELYLRDSIVGDPLLDRCVVTSPMPVVIHTEIVSGTRLSFTIALKGGGAENMSTLRMFPPTTPPRDIQQYIIDSVVSAGGRPCPPVIVGVGIGGNFEQCAINAKKALFKPLTMPNDDSRYAAMEKSILMEINAKGSGAMGMGGETTALAVHIITAPCHIASLPVAVNIQCHSHRHTSFEV